MAKRRVMLVDDECCPGQKEPNGIYMWYYAQALRDADFEVTEVISPDDALLEMAAEGASFDLIVLDIMMPPGEAYKEVNTLEGLRTGVFLGRTLQESYPDLPVVVLTNLANPQILNQVKELTNVKATFSKSYCPPFELAREVKVVVES